MEIPAGIPDQNQRREFLSARFEAGQTETGGGTGTFEIAHVLFMDIVSFSLESAERQKELVDELYEVVRSTPAFQQAQERGKLIALDTGDGEGLVFFDDPMAPLRCALQIAQVIQKRPMARLRMGVNSGVIQRVVGIGNKENVAGPGANYAQRAMDCGESGHILVSNFTADLVIEMGFWKRHLHDIGEYEVKHGKKVFLYNLYTETLGNPSIPPKRIVTEALPNQSFQVISRRSRIIAQSEAKLGKMWQVVPFVLKGLLLISVVLLLHAGVMKSSVGRHLRNLQYTMLQNSLIAHYWSVKPYEEVRLPIIIDISSRIPNAPNRPTDLESLDKLIKALRALSPKAIGIDIDFSPGETLIRPTDWNIFSQWSQLTRLDDSKPLFVKVGVYRRLYDAPANWLGRSEFRSLAAGIAVPDDSQNNYYYVQAGNSEEDRLPQMAAALYEATGGRKPSTGGILPKIYTETSANRRYGFYVVDYSYMQEISENQVIRYDEPDLLKAFKDKIKDNVVLIGDVEYGEDKFTLAHTSNHISGVLIHACSLMTLRRGALRYIDERRSIVLDLMLSLSSLLIIAFLPFLIQLKTDHRDPEFKAAKIRLFSLSALMVFSFSYWWIRWAGVFWPDFLWISVALFLNPFLAHPLWCLIRGGCETTSSILRWVFKEGYNHAH